MPLRKKEIENKITNYRAIIGAFFGKRLPNFLIGKRGKRGSLGKSFLVLRKCRGHFSNVCREEPSREPSHVWLQRGGVATHGKTSLKNAPHFPMCRSHVWLQLATIENKIAALGLFASCRGAGRSEGSVATLSYSLCGYNLVYQKPLVVVFCVFRATYFYVAREKYPCVATRFTAGCAYGNVTFHVGFSCRKIYNVVLC